MNGRTIKQRAEDFFENFKNKDELKIPGNEDWFVSNTHIIVMKSNDLDVQEKLVRSATIEDIDEDLGNPEDMDFYNDAEAEANLSLDKLLEILSALENANYDSVKLKMSTDKPLVVEAKNDDDKTEIILAPRVE